MGKGKNLVRNDVRNPDHKFILEECARLHELKSHDYASEDNVFFNFEYATRVAEPFNGVHKTFATLMGVKMARLAELLKGKVPKNEAKQDSFIDNTNYSAIWGSYSMQEDRKKQQEAEKLYEDQAIRNIEYYELKAELAELRKILAEKQARSSVKKGKKNVKSSR